jgi:hypothetical protein
LDAGEFNREDHALVAFGSRLLLIDVQCAPRERLSAAVRSSFKV